MKSIQRNGGLKQLTLTELRTLVIIVFSHQTLCRYADLSCVRLSNLKFKTDFFKIKIPFSKNDQSGEGHSVILPRL